MSFSTDRVTMTGSEVSYTTPVDVQSITLQAVGTNATLTFESGATDGFTIYDGVPVTFNTRQRPKFYLTGTNAARVEILYETTVA